jgi:hypothetical protein
MRCPVRATSQISGWATIANAATWNRPNRTTNAATSPTVAAIDRRAGVPGAGAALRGRGGGAGG